MDHDKRENLDGYMTELAVAETDNETDTLMKLILANVASGVTAVELDGDKVEYLFANDKFCSMLGYTKEQYQKEVKDTYSLFHPDDRGRIYELVHLLQPGDNPLTLEYRMLCRDGSYKKIRMVIVSTEFGHEKKVLQLSVFEDITEEYKAKELQEELLDNLPCGAGTFELKDNELKVLYLNQKYWELVGRKPESSKTQSVSDVILPEDRGVVRHTIRRVFESNQEQECEVHILHEDGHYIPFVVRASIVVHKSGKRTMYVTYTPITENAVTFRRMLPSVLDNMMASSMDYCFVKDRGLHYVCASKTFAELVGYDDAKDIIGKTDFDLFPQDIAEKIRLEDMKVLESGEAIRNSVERLPLRSKEIRYSNKSKYLLRDSSGFVIGIYATARDITEDKEVYSRLKTLTDTIPGGLATYEMKGDKIYSRYISEGVMNLVGYSENREELLRKDPRELIAKDDIDGMQKQISRMVIINDVLDMSRIEQDKIVLTPEPYSYIEFERTIRNVIDELSRKRNIEFVIDTSQVGAPEIYVDHVRFNQIFINLLSNAVKFTNKGGKVELIIQELNSEKNGERIKRFIVRDNGIGMSEDFVPHAFESFNQEYRKDTSERNLGTGLGLSIVEKLVDMMGGTIKLESKMNQGTTFTVDFPYDLHKVTDDVKHQETKTYDYSRLRGIRILLAEDNDINTEIAIALLEKYGSIVERSENGEEAYLKYKASEKNYFQLILMDIRMPVMDGLTATKKIRALRRTDAKTIPIIAMTADAFNEDEKTAYKAGMNAHVAKPINPTQLYEVCLNYI